MVLGILDSSNNDLNGFFVRFEKTSFLVKCEPGFDHRSKSKAQLALKNVLILLSGCGRIFRS